MSKPHVPFKNIQLCGANAKRTGKPCRQPAMSNGRCRLHGGKSTGRPVTTGQWTKQAIKQENESNEVLRQLRHLMKTME